MQESTYFYYDGVFSKDMGVYIASTKSGLFDETFLPSREIIETSVAHREKPYLQRVVSQPLSLSFSIVIEDYSDVGKLREIARWLFKSEYKQLYFDSSPERHYYAMVQGDSNIYHNGLKQGYIELTFRCDSPYSYTAEHVENDIEYRDSESETVIENSGADFDLGEHNNTINTSNGLTVNENIEYWKQLFIKAQYWKEII